LIYWGKYGESGRIEASYKNGILRINLAKSKKEIPRR
jgi:HSP20 family molecular chaperone IbpA